MGYHRRMQTRASSHRSVRFLHPMGRIHVPAHQGSLTNADFLLDSELGEVRKRLRTPIRPLPRRWGGPNDRRDAYRHRDVEFPVPHERLFGFVSADAPNPDHYRVDARRVKTVN